MIWRLTFNETPCGCIFEIDNEGYSHISTISTCNEHQGKTFTEMKILSIEDGIRNEPEETKDQIRQEIYQIHGIA